MDCSLLSQILEDTKFFFAEIISHSPNKSQRWWWLGLGLPVSLTESRLTWEMGSGNVWNELLYQLVWEDQPMVSDTCSLAGIL